MRTTEIAKKKKKKTPFCDCGSWLKVILNFAFSVRSSSCLNELSPSSDVFFCCGESCVGQEAKTYVTQFLSRIMYFSYRNCFDRLPNGETTDAGWGCLLRSAQMLMAVVLLRNGSPDGALPSYHGSNTGLLHQFQHVESFFMDHPNAPFSIHRLEEEAHKNGCAYGAFLSPTAIADALLGASTRLASSSSMMSRPLKCLRANTIKKNEIQSYLDENQSILFLVSLVCGYKRITALYQDVLFSFLKCKNCCGLLLGQDKAAYFAFGCQNPNFLCLDPHYVQKAYGSETTRGHRRSKFITVPATVVETSIMVAFYIRNLEDLSNLCDTLTSINCKLPIPLIPIMDY